MRTFTGKLPEARTRTDEVAGTGWEESVLLADPDHEQARAMASFKKRDDVSDALVTALATGSHTLAGNQCGTDG